METLDPYAEMPIGFDVDLFSRNESGQLERRERHETLILPEMRFNKQRLLETLTPAEELPFATLLAKHPKGLSAVSEKEAQSMSVLYYKMALPWLALFAVVAPAPFCVRLSALRGNSLFF
jgi:lipopolysaccharide export system permease protein